MPSVFFTLPSIATAATVLRPSQKCGNKGFHTLIAYTYYLPLVCHHLTHYFLASVELNRANA